MTEYKISDLTIYPEILKNNGYSKFSDPMKKSDDTYVESWQKCVRNEFGKAYFINIYFSDMSFYLSRSGLNANPYGWEADLQFESPEDKMTMNLKIFSSKQSLQELESFCEKMFTKMNFPNYEYYSEDDEKNHSQKMNIIQSKDKLEEELPQKEEVKKSKRKNKV